MSLGMRVLLATVIVLGDFIAFFIPLGSCFLAYVLVAKPLWVKQWVEAFYA